MNLEKANNRGSGILTRRHHTTLSRTDIRPSPDPLSHPRDSQGGPECGRRGVTGRPSHRGPTVVSDVSLTSWRCSSTPRPGQSCSPCHWRRGRRGSDTPLVRPSRPGTVYPERNVSSHTNRWSPSPGPKSEPCPGIIETRPSQGNLVFDTGGTRVTTRYKELNSGPFGSGENRLKPDRRG